MRIVRDIGYVKRRKRLGTLTALGGFLLLAAAFWLATAGRGGPNAVLIAYIPLLTGTVLFHFGMQQLAKWSRNPRNDVLLDNALRNLGDKYALIHYAAVGKRVVEHILIHPGGVLSLTVRELPGKVTYRDGRWRRQGSGFGRFFGIGGPQLGNPSADAQADVNALTTLLADAQLEADVDGAIVFVNPAVELDVAEPDFPVMNGEGLPEFVRTLPVDPTLRPTERQALVDLLAKGEEVQKQTPAPRRRPVKRRAA